MERMIIIILLVIILCLFAVLWKYGRQVRDICRQLRFIMEKESNALVTSDMRLGGLDGLVDTLNEMLGGHRKQRQQWQKKEQMIADTYSSLSHDIRTPLTSLDGYFQLWTASEDAEERERYIAVIRGRIDGLREMLEELFTFTKLKNETYELPLAVCDINLLVKDTLFSYYEEWELRGITPVLVLPDQPVKVMGNRMALDRTLQNMIKNALDHGERELEIRLWQQDAVYLEVRNRVCNPEEIDAEQVFERFYKADEARSKSSTGLGLSIAREFVLRMHGDISARLEGDLFCVQVMLPEMRE